MPFYNVPFSFHTLPGLFIPTMGSSLTPRSFKVMPNEQQVSWKGDYLSIHINIRVFSISVNAWVVNLLSPLRKRPELFSHYFNRIGGHRRLEIIWRKPTPQSQFPNSLY
jgi:hypothetical protein